MPEQIKKTASSRKATEMTSQSSATANKDVKNLTAELDSLLDEIDEVLESNAEEFVKSYVQKGGQ
jgi:prokaryotic ubiquitin-like protein Pup